MLEEYEEAKELYANIRVNINVMRGIAIRSPRVYYTRLMDAVNSLSDAAFILEKILNPRNEVSGEIADGNRREGLP